MLTKKLSFAQRLKNLFTGKKLDSEFFEDLTDALIEGDLGAKNSLEITDTLEAICKRQGAFSQQEITAQLKSILLEYLKAASLDVDGTKTNIFMVLGVNGVGKTTTAAKMARLYSSRGIKVILAAADTFRAAAIDQLALHAERLDVRIVKHQMGSDPSAVVFDAASACGAAGGGLVIADTAGRLHNKENLVGELAKIERICTSKASPGCCKKILVVDATTGQNALRQAEVFHEAVGVDALVLTKCDSTAKGGSLVAIGKELGIPAMFVCTGEGYDDIAPFDAQNYADEFLGL